MICEELKKPGNKYEAASTLLGSERPFGQVHLLWPIFGLEEINEEGRNLSDGKDTDEDDESEDDDDAGEVLLSVILNQVLRAIFLITCIPEQMPKSYPALDQRLALFVLMVRCISIVLSILGNNVNTSCFWNFWYV